MSPVDSNKNAVTTQSRTYTSNLNPTKFTLHTNNLPRPEYPVRLEETKTAKTLANTNRKINSAPLARQSSPMHDASPKDGGSSTEDSGVGSNTSGTTQNEHLGIAKELQILNESPTFGARRFKQKARTLDVVLSGNTFDLRDVDESAEPAVPLPRFPSVFQCASTGIVRERALEYEKCLDRNARKISITSSEGCSDYGEEQKNYNEKHSNEKNYKRPTPVKSFLKSREIRINDSPPSSDDQLWVNAGEAMADDMSYSFSSSDESKDTDHRRSTRNHQFTSSMRSDAFETLISATLNNTLPKNEIKNVLLTIEDPKFAAIAGQTTNLLEDETSPTESLICSYSESEEYRKKINKSSSNSKDVNEKLTLTPSSPGTPTNASNSLSLSEGKDFLIDDEIADQPALVFDDNVTAGGNSESVNTRHNSENSTLIESTPKAKRKLMMYVEQSPMLSRTRRSLLNRSDSMETLSTCESIASDDMMLDFDCSQTSGLDETQDRFVYFTLHVTDWAVKPLGKWSRSHLT